MDLSLLFAWIVAILAGVACIGALARIHRRAFEIDPLNWQQVPH